MSYFYFPCYIFRTTKKVTDFTSGRGANKTIIGCNTLQNLVDSLQSPRVVCIVMLYIVITNNILYLCYSVKLTEPYLVIYIYIYIYQLFRSC